MAKQWRKINTSGKIHVRDTLDTEYYCGVKVESVDKKLPRKPRKGDFCKNCLRIDNK